MLANRKTQLPKYLRAIKTKSVEMSLTSDVPSLSSATVTAQATSNDGNSSLLVPPVAPSTPGTGSTSRNTDIMTNFKDLLQFWQSHYLQKDKDCVGLELNSRIEFSYWKSTVDLLLDKDQTNECSLMFYLCNDMDRLKTSAKNKMDEHRSE
jgi:hypothetical protein